MEKIFYIKTNSPKNYEIVDGKLFYAFKENYDENSQVINSELISDFHLSIMEELIYYQNKHKTTKAFIDSYLKEKNLIKETDSEKTIQLKKEKLDKIIDDLVAARILTIINKSSSDNFYQSKILKNVFLKTTYHLEFKENKFTMYFLKDLDNINNRVEILCKKEQYLFLLSLKSETMMDAYYDFKSLIENYSDVYYQDYEIHNLFFNYVSSLNRFFEVEYNESKMKEGSINRISNEKTAFQLEKDNLSLLPIGSVYALINRENQYIYLHKAKRNKLRQISFKEYLLFKLINKVSFVNESITYIYENVFLDDELFNSVNDLENTIHNMYNKKMIVDFNDDSYELLNNHSFFRIPGLIKKYDEYDISIDISDEKEKIIIPLTKYKELFLSVEDTDISQMEIYSLLKIYTANNCFINVEVLNKTISDVVYIYKNFIYKDEFNNELKKRIDTIAKKDIHLFIQYNLFDVVIN